MFNLVSRAAELGARVALRTPNSAVTYAELAQRVAAVQAALSNQGVRAHHRVVLRCAADVETMTTALALLQLRCVVLPVADDVPDATRQDSLDAFAAVWEVRQAEATPRWRDSPKPRDDGTPPLQALLSSGSAGRPKIVLRSAAQVQAGVRIFTTAMRLGPADRVLLLVPLEHSFGFNSVMLGALSAGAQIVIPGSRHPRGIVPQVEASGVTLFPAPPLFFEWMHRFADGPPRRLGGVRACVSVGDLLPRTTYDAFVARFGVSLWQSYGASEAGPLLLNRSGAGTNDTLALGQPYPEVEIEIRDEHGDCVPDGTVGELGARSPAVGLGYLGEHDAASRLVDGEFFSGDLGYRQHGEIYFAGRRKLLITRAGRKLDPAEIERALRRHPRVIDAAVLAVGGSGRDPLRALLVARQPIGVDEIIEHCARLLEPHKIPRLIEFRNELPRDAAGKLNRGKLPTW